MCRCRLQLSSVHTPSGFHASSFSLPLSLSLSLSLSFSFPPSPSLSLSFCLSLSPSPSFSLFLCLFPKPQTLRGQSTKSFPDGTGRAPSTRPEALISCRTTRAPATAASSSKTTCRRLPERRGAVRRSKRKQQRQSSRRPSRPPAEEVMSPWCLTIYRSRERVWMQPFSRRPAFNVNKKAHGQLVGFLPQ